MKTITKMMLTLALCLLGVGNLIAQEGTKTPIKLTGATNNPTIEPIEPSTLDDLYAATFIPTADFSNIFQYKPLDVDFSQYDKIVIEFGGENGVQGNWQINLPGAAQNNVQIAAGTKKYEIPLNGVTSYQDFTIFNWAGERTPITITECYFFKSADPYASQKAALSDKIALAKMYNGVAYTESSFSALTSEISSSEETLAAAASAESLTTATTNLQAKIDALTLADGYVNLTADMFKAWDKADAADAVATGTVGCAVNMFTSTDLPYGEASVGYLHYADLTSYEKLIIVATAGKPRVMMNRVVNGGPFNDNEEESKMIEMPKDGTWTDRYYTQNGVVFTYDLALIASEKGFAHLNTIKDFNWGKVTVTGMYLYKAPDALASFKEALSKAINTAKLYTGLGKTEDSFTALTSAISAAETALAAADATEESLTTATTNLQDAIDGLTLAENYAMLTKDMFKTYASIETPGEGSSAGCAYELFTASGLPYGDGNVGEKNWADLATYDKLIVVTSGSVKPRFCFNRLEAGGNQAATKAESKMIDINPNNNFTWSNDAYQTIEGNVYTINLKKILSDYGFVRLHCIKKQGWGDGVFVTDMLLYTEPDPLAGDKGVLSDKIAEAKGINTFAKTEATVAVLTQAISDGENALKAADATAESLGAAVTAINEAIAGLKLAAGYAKVTKNMFMTWNGDDASAKATGVSSAGVDNIGVENAGVPYGYGSGNVFWYHYTDLTPFEKLCAIGTPGKRARYLFNRPMNPEDPSGEGTSDFIQKYVDINSDGIAELTLSEVSTEFVHLNTFKAPDGGTTFTDFLVYAAKTNVTVGEAGYTTFNSIMNVDLTGVTGYAAKYNGEKLVLTKIDAVPANKAIIIEAAAGNYSLTNIEQASTIDTDLLVSDGAVAGDGTIYAMANGGNGVGFYRVAAGVTVPAGKAYLKIEASAREFIGFGDDVVTGITNVNREAMTNNRYYNLNGQRVEKAQKGLYIINGKKIVK